MQTYPLSSISLEEAKALQFKVVDAITRRFDGKEILSLGDLGVAPPSGHPKTTQKAEQVFAEVFDAEDALFVQGAGTGAIRFGLLGMMQPTQKILVHKAPVYPTTKDTLDSMAMEIIIADFNDLKDIERVLEETKVDGALVQHTRQAPEDFYDFEKVIKQIKKSCSSLPIITDDNYAALKVSKIGSQAGADLATFSCFKILGPEGVGVILGKKEFIQKIRKSQYSGGSQIQGHQALSAIRGLIYAPVSLAIQSDVNEELVKRLEKGEVPFVKNAFLANAQSKVLLIEFEKPIAEELLVQTALHGAASHPVGSESIYEFVPMMYRVSGTFRKQDPTLEKRMIRVNPMRSGADTVIRILQESLKALNL